MPSIWGFLHNCSHEGDDVGVSVDPDEIDYRVFVLEPYINNPTLHWSYSPIRQPFAACPHVGDMVSLADWPHEDVLYRVALVVHHDAGNRIHLYVRKVGPLDEVLRELASLESWEPKWEGQEV